MSTEPKTRTITIEEGFHQDTVTGRYFARLKIAGTNKRTMRRLKGRTLKEATKQFRKLQEGGATPVATVAMVVGAYEKAGCPGEKKRTRTPKFLKDERARLVFIKDFFDGMKAADVNLGHCEKYHDWRITKLKKKASGARTVDMDMTTASNAFRFGTLNGTPQPMMARNPWATGRPHYADPVHCREHCCRSGDELHNIAHALGGLVALQFLFEACSGCRTGEAIPLRRGAPDKTPGHILETEDGKRWLCICRLKQGGDDPYDYIEILPELALVLRALDEYHAKLKKPSPWLFPGRTIGGDKRISEGALAKALRTKRVRKLIQADRKLTSHGARAFYCTWRRSQGIPDAVIAAEMGHQGGTRLLETTYGRRQAAYKKGLFTPIPATAKPFWGEQGATSFDTSSERITVLSQSMPVHNEVLPVNVILLNQNAN